MPYVKLFTWITEETKKPLVNTFMPSGSFTFLGPPGATYSMPQIIEYINQDLRQMGFEITMYKDCFILDSIRDE